jgi:hypothetical protein
LSNLLRPALDRLFDDAGLFPPAKLPMADALAAHARGVAGPYRWVMGPFLCPASRLEELDACVAAGVPRPALLGVIGYEGQAPWRRVFATPGLVQVEAPVTVQVSPPPGRLTLYLEIPHHGRVDQALDLVAVAGARAKVRCGGLTRDAVPTCDWLAAVLVGCAARRLALKATAGLHQAYRGSGPSGPHHGFLNLLVAAGAARAGVPVPDVSAILATEEGSEGDSTSGPLGSANELAQSVTPARELLVSIGTCSIDEPISELVSRGLL